MYLRLVVALFLAATLAGCGVFGGGKGKTEAAARPPVDSNRPPTKDIIKSLPKGLIGDSQNARHTNEELKGDGGKP
jgi:hypothetical protein